MGTLEHTHSPVSTTAPQEGGETSLSAVVRRAAAETEGQRRSDAGRAVAARLAAMATVGPEHKEAAATEVLALLDGGAFAGLEDDSGTTLQSAAVSTVLALGYPWALQLSPDDLAVYRRAASSDVAPAVAYRAASAAAAALAMVQVTLFAFAAGTAVSLSRLPPAAWLGLTAYLALAGFGVAQWTAPPKTTAHTLGRLGTFLAAATLSALLIQQMDSAGWQSGGFIRYVLDLAVAALGVASAVLPRTSGEDGD